MGDTVGAVSAYQDALRIDGNRSTFWSALARAQAQSGDRDGAIASLQRAVQLDPNNQSAQNGLRALGVTAATASATPAATVSTQAGAPTQAAGETLPETPSRAQIIDVMRPLQAQIRGCAPGYAGRVTFSFVVTGRTGMVGESSVAEEDMLEQAEVECMANVVRNATFPPFTRETLEITYPYAL
jgi:tetratricopeptide (TPR) repeat protein